jgi:branched-subunit amino acid transport protein AzlD
MFDAGLFYLIYVIIPAATLLNATLLLPFPRFVKSALLTPRVRSYAEMFTMMTFLILVFYVYCLLDADFTDLHLNQNMIQRTSDLAKKYHIERNFHTGLLAFLNWLCAWAGIYYTTKVKELEAKVKQD